MAEGPDSSVLEHLRQFRSELSFLLNKMSQGFATINQRLERIEFESRGVNYVATVSTGSVLGLIEDPKDRISRLETS